MTWAARPRTDSVRAEKGLVRLVPAAFLLFFIFGMFAHTAACLAAALTEGAIRAGVLFRKDYFLHILV